MYIPKLYCLEGGGRRRLTGNATHLPSNLQKPDHLQRLLDIWDLLAQAHCAPLRVDLHELVFRDHLLEAAEGGLDVFARGDVVADIIDEGGDGDPARVCLSFH